VEQFFNNPTGQASSYQAEGGVEFGLSLPEQIADVLSSEIIEGKLPPGSKLPEPTLAERFGTSRAPIREALYLLDQEGLVERAPRRGAVVREYSRREIEELYRIRSVLEGFALEHICEEPEMIEVCVATLEPIIRDMERTESDPKRYHELNFAFHKTIILLSRSQLIRRLYAQIEGPLKIFLRLSFSTAGAVPKSFGEHLQLLAAIREENVEEARRILEKHDEDGMRRAIASGKCGQTVKDR
jgi:DNA-binding GntR family transcriptional regulator